MEKHVLIRVTSIQRDEKGKDDKISLETPGLYREEGEIKSISYKETKLVGMEGTTTSLHVYPDKIELVRRGAFIQQQSYIIGKKMTSSYRTPMGTMEVSTMTRKIRSTLDKGNGSIYLAYDVELKGLFNHLNIINVEVREDPKFHGSQRTAQGNH